MSAVKKTIKEFERQFDSDESLHLICADGFSPQRYRVTYRDGPREQEFTFYFDTVGLVFRADYPMYQIAASIHWADVVRVKRKLHSEIKFKMEDKRKISLFFSTVAELEKFLEYCISHKIFKKRFLRAGWTVSSRFHDRWHPAVSSKYQSAL